MMRRALLLIGCVVVGALGGFFTAYTFDPSTGRVTPRALKASYVSATISPDERHSLVIQREEPLRTLFYKTQLLQQFVASNAVLDRTAASMHLPRSDMFGVSFPTKTEQTRKGAYEGRDERSVDYAMGGTPYQLISDMYQRSPQVLLTARAPTPAEAQRLLDHALNAVDAELAERAGGRGRSEIVIKRSGPMSARTTGLAQPAIVATVAGAVIALMCGLLLILVRTSLRKPVSSARAGAPQAQA